jgi:hypothetical protein
VVVVLVARPRWFVKGGELLPSSGQKLAVIRRLAGLAGLMMERRSAGREDGRVD